MRAIYCRQIQRLGLSNTPQRILDVGCGTGIWTKQLSELGATIGMDYSREALAFCRTHKLPNILAASACEIPFKPGTFSLVTAFGVIEHVDEDTKMLSELHRACKSGGYIFLLTSAYRFLWSSHDDFVHHKRRYLQSELAHKVREVGFEIVKISYINSILFPAIAVARMLQRIERLQPKSAKEVTQAFEMKGFLNKVLLKILKIEAFLLQFISFPFGVGLLCIARKPA